MLRSQNVAIRIPLFICNFVILNRLPFMINWNKLLILSNNSRNYISYLAIQIKWIEIAIYCYHYYQWDICFRFQRIPLCIKYPMIWGTQSSLWNALSKRISFHHRETLTKKCYIKCTSVKKSRSVDRLKSFLHVFFISFPVKRQFAATYSSQHAFVFNMTDTVSSLKLWRHRLFTPLHLNVKCWYIFDS